MIITGRIATPDTFLAHSTPEEATTHLLNYMAAEPNRYIFLVNLPGVYKVWLTGVKNKIGTEMVYTTEAEALEVRDRQAKFFSPRECYLVELSIKEKEPAVDINGDLPQITHARFMDTAGRPLWDQSFSPTRNVFKVNECFVFDNETWTVTHVQAADEYGTYYVFITNDTRKTA